MIILNIPKILKIIPHDYPVSLIVGSITCNDEERNKCVTINNVISKLVANDNRFKSNSTLIPFDPNSPRE